MATLYRKQVGEAIRARRVEMGLSQSELGQRVGVESQTVSRWERGANLGKEGNLELAARALETSVKDLMSGIEGPANGVQPKRSQLDRIEAKLDALLKAAGVSAPREGMVAPTGEIGRSGEGADSSTGRPVRPPKKPAADRKRRSA